MGTIKSGGGINSDKTVQSRSGYKVEPRSTAIDPAGISQRDISTAFRKTPVEVGAGYSPSQMPATGVKGSYNSATLGPGSGRTVYARGSQAEYGPVNPGQVNQAPDVPATRPGRDILSDYGPEMKRGR